MKLSVKLLCCVKMKTLQHFNQNISWATINFSISSSIKLGLRMPSGVRYLEWRSQGQLQTRPRFCSKLEINGLVQNQGTLWHILRYKPIIYKVSLKLHNKALPKTFCIDTENLFYSHSDENENFTISFFLFLNGPRSNVWWSPS